MFHDHQHENKDGRDCPTTSFRKPKEQLINRKPTSGWVDRMLIECKYMYTQATKRQASSHSKKRCSSVSSAIAQKQRLSTPRILNLMAKRAPVGRTPCAICQLRSTTLRSRSQMCNWRHVSGQCKGP